MKTLQIVWFTILAIFACIDIQAVDITVRDRFSTHSYYGVDPRAGVDESGSVSPGAVANATWDLRALTFDPSTTKITSIGGFNPLTVNQGFRIGDIFIDLNGDVGQVGRPAVNGYFSRPNPGFEYVIHLGPVQGGGVEYDIYELDAGSMVETGYYHQFGLADPWAFLPNGEKLIGSGVSPVSTLSSLDVLSQYGADVGNNGLNYLLGFNVPALAGRDFEAYQTLQCLNDSIQGGYKVSESGNTFLLGSFGIIGVLSFMRRCRVC